MVLVWLQNVENIMSRLFCNYSQSVLWVISWIVTDFFALLFKYYVFFAKKLF